MHYVECPDTYTHTQGRIKGGAKGAAAPGPAVLRGPHFRK